MLAVRVWASELRWQWFWVRWKEEILSFHQDPTKFKNFDLCWRKLNFKLDLRFFSVEIFEKSKIRKSKKQGFQLKILIFEKFQLKSLFFRFFDFSKCSTEKKSRANFKINFLQHRSKIFNLVGSWWKLSISVFQRIKNHCQRSSDSSRKTSWILELLQYPGINIKMRAFFK